MQKDVESVAAAREMAGHVQLPPVDQRLAFEGYIVDERSPRCDF